MAGCIGTSNAMAADMLNMSAIGTMAHSFIESFDSELEAFITYAKINPHNCTLLVDTYDTLRSGVPNAIKAFEYLRDNNMVRVSRSIRDLMRKRRKSFVMSSLSVFLPMKSIRFLRRRQKPAFYSLTLKNRISLSITFIPMILVPPTTLSSSGVMISLLVELRRQTRLNSQTFIRMISGFS